MVQVVDENNPEAFIESCAREAVEEAINITSMNGGDLSPKGFMVFDGGEVTYLCFSYDTYLPCTNQRPLLVEHLENEITDYITPKIEECFNDLKKRLGNRYSIETSATNIITKLQSESVTVIINKKFKMSRDGEVRDIKEFRMHITHPLYNLAKLAMEIVNQEVRFCNFDELGYALLNPEYDIVKVITGDADIIYKIKGLETNQEFRFAVRSCALPAGY